MFKLCGSITVAIVSVLALAGCGGDTSTFKRAVVMIGGQSNAANHGEGLHTCREEVWMLYHDLFPAKDPLLGASGSGGSWGSRLGDLMRADGWDEVVLIPTAIGGTQISYWEPGGGGHLRLLEAIQDAKNHKTKITHFLWCQGESDKWYKTPGSVYQTSFLAMLKSMRGCGMKAPVFVFLTTWYDGSASPELRATQQGLVDHRAGIWLGPDTDLLIGPKYRSGPGGRGPHFTGAGLDEVALECLACLR